MRMRFRAGGAVGCAAALALAGAAGVAPAETSVGPAPAGDGGLRLVDVSGRLAGFRRPNGPHNAGGLAGLAWFDYDGDGRLDLFVPNNVGHPNALFRNLGGGRFADVAARAGVDNGLGNAGVAVADVDNDGCKDLVAGGTGGIESASQGPTKLYLNACDGTFKDITRSSGVTGTKTTGAVAFADINNDGYVDLFLASAGDFENRKHPNKLYLNNGDRTFREIGAAAGIQRNLGAVPLGFTDYDKDGLQDILVPDGNGGVMQPLKAGDPASFQPIPTAIKLYRNNGDLTFTDVAVFTGLLNQLGFWMSVTLGDVDNDSDLDFFSTNAGNAPGGPPFQQFQPPVEVRFPHGLWKSQSSPLSLLTNPVVPLTVGLSPDPLATVSGALSGLSGSLAGLPAASRPSDAETVPALAPDPRQVFYRQVSREAGVSKLNWGWGATFADFDRDGHEDLWFNGSYPGLGGLIHNAPFMGEQFGNPGYLLRNTGGGALRLAQTFGQQNSFTSGSAVADFDNDGRPDVAVLNTAFGDDPGAPILLRNDTAGDNGWITVALVGTSSNRDAIGAKVRVLAGPLTKLKEVRSGSSFLSMDSPWLTFGLGPEAPARVPVEVTWPSGLLETFDAPSGRNVTLREGTGRGLGSAPSVP